MLNFALRLIDKEELKAAEKPKRFGWTRYYNLNEINNWIDQLLIQYPNTLTNYNYGKSYEGRTLRAIKVSMKKVR